jgi:septum formation protein
MENEQRPQADEAPLACAPPGLEPLVLASASPRRAEILRAVGWPFTTSGADIDETRAPAEDPVEYVERLALAKAEAVAARGPDLVLGADTVVTIDGLVLGKPRDEEDARRMLRCLSGRWHEVLTGVAFVRTRSPQRLVAHERTRVKFAAVSEAEIDWYIATREPMDKAGAYAVQGRAALFIEKIEGDYWNVVGLPVRRVYSLAQRLWPCAH